MVTDDEILSITFLGEYLSINKRSVNIVSARRYHYIIFFRKVLFGCFCVIFSTESFGIICFRSEEVVCMYIDYMGCRVNGNRLVPHYNSSRKLPMTKSHGG